MKRLLILAALMMAALTMRAQAPASGDMVPADSVSVMFRHLQNTNAEVVRLNRAYTTHTVVTSGGAAVMAVGLLYAIRREETPGYAEPQLQPDHIRTGLGIAAAGALVIVAGVCTMPRRVHVDGRGLVVDIP